MLEKQQYMPQQPLFVSVCVQSCFSTFFLFEMLTVNKNEILRYP